MYKFIFIVFIFISNNVFAAVSSSDVSKDLDNFDQVKILYDRAEKYINEKKYKKSLKLLKALTKRKDLNGLRSDIYNLLSCTYRKIQNRNLDKSFATYMMALEINPKHIGTHEYLGELYLILGELEKSKIMLNKLELLAGIEFEEYLDLKSSIDNF